MKKKTREIIFSQVWKKIPRVKKSHGSKKILMREKISQVKKILGFKNSPEYEKKISEVKNTLGSKIFWKKYFFGIWKKSLASLKNFLASLKNGQSSYLGEGECCLQF